MEVVSDPALAKRIMLRMISVGERDFAESSLERRWWITSLFGVDLFARPVFLEGRCQFQFKKRKGGGGRRERKKRKRERHTFQSLFLRFHHMQSPPFGHFSRHKCFDQQTSQPGIDAGNSSNGLIICGKHRHMNDRFGPFRRRALSETTKRLAIGQFSNDIECDE